MNRCMEIQSQITDYIEGNLAPDKLEEFISHINSCEECREELNIYYTLYHLFIKNKMNKLFLLFIIGIAISFPVPPNLQSVVYSFI